MIQSKVLKIFFMLVVIPFSINGYPGQDDLKRFIPELYCDAILRSYQTKLYQAACNMYNQKDPLAMNKEGFLKVHFEVTQAKLYASNDNRFPTWFSVRVITTEKPSEEQYWNQQLDLLKNQIKAKTSEPISPQFYLGYVVNDSRNHNKHFYLLYYTYGVSLMDKIFVKGRTFDQVFELRSKLARPRFQTYWNILNQMRQIHDAGRVANANIYPWMVYVNHYDETNARLIVESVPFKKGATEYQNPDYRHLSTFFHDPDVSVCIDNNMSIEDNIYSLGALIAEIEVNSYCMIHTHPFMSTFYPEYIAEIKAVSHARINYADDQDKKAEVEFTDWMLKMIAPNRNNRFKSVSEALNALEKIIDLAPKPKNNWALFNYKITTDLIYQCFGHKSKFHSNVKWEDGQGAKGPDCQKNLQNKGSVTMMSNIPTQSNQMGFESVKTGSHGNSAHSSINTQSNQMGFDSGHRTDYSSLDKSGGYSSDSGQQDNEERNMDMFSSMVVRNPNQNHSGGLAHKRSLVKELFSNKSSKEMLIV